MNVIKIQNMDNPGLEAYTRLTEAQLRNRLEPEKGVFIAESPKVIRLALDAGCEPLSVMTEERHVEGDARDILARVGDIPVYTGERELLASITGFTLTRGVLCAMRRPAPLTASELIKNAGRVAVLEGITDSTNIGAIFRSAAALGMDAVILTTTSCDPLNRRAVRVSMGTVFQIPWAYADDWQSLMGSAGFKTCAMALTDDSLSVADPRLKAEPKLGIVLGTEGDGLAKSTITACDYTVKIPMYHGVDSLNVAAASAVAFWELRRVSG